MDGGFDHEDPNNRPEEIPLNDLDFEDNDSEYFDTYDNPYGETSFISGGTHMEISNVDKGRPIETLVNSSEYQRIQRDRELKRKANIIRSAILDITGNEWNVRIDSLNTRDFLDNIEIKKNGSIWYKGKIVYKRVGEKYVISRDKKSKKYITEFRQQLKDINTDFLEGISSDDQKIGQFITVNNYLANIPVEIEVKTNIKGIIDNVLDFDPTETGSPETTVNELENTLYDIRSELKKVDPENTEIRRYYLRLIDYLQNNVDILRIRSGLSTKYNNLDKTDYGRLRRIKDFLKRNFGIVAFVTIVVGGLAGLVITIISFVRSGVSSAAKGASKAGKSIWDFAKKVQS